MIGPNCLQRLSAENTSRQRINYMNTWGSPLNKCQKNEAHLLCLHFYNKYLPNIEFIYTLGSIKIKPFNVSLC